MIRQHVADLVKLGVFPSSDDATDTIESQEKLLLSITKPVSDDEARALVGLFGPDDYYGMAWSLIHLIETAPGWPIADCLTDQSNEWVSLLATRVANAKHPPGESVDT